MTELATTPAPDPWSMGIDARLPHEQTFPPKGHPRVRAVCVKKPYGFVFNPDKKKQFPAGCGAWRCRACARMLAYRVRKRLEPLEWTAKLELTLDGDGAPTRENNLRLARGTRSLLQFVRRYFRRKYGREWKLRYARMHGVGEVGGRLHSHMLWDAPFIPQAVLSEHAEACGLGFRVYIRGIDHRHAEGDQAARYVADQAVGYVSRQADSPAGTRDLPPRARRFQSALVAPYKPEEGWQFHRHCPFGLPCEFCGLCPEPEVFRLEWHRAMRWWDVSLTTGEMQPRELTLRALRSLVTSGETASPEDPKPEYLPHQGEFFGEEPEDNSS